MPKHGTKGDLFGAVDERLKWTQETPYNLLSNCQRYRISKALTLSGPVYHLWLCGKVPHLLMGTLAECKEAAASHRGAPSTPDGSSKVTASPSPTARR